MRVLLSLIATLIVSNCVIGQNTNDINFQAVYRGSAGIDITGSKKNGAQMSLFLVNGLQCSPKVFLGCGFAFPFAAEPEKNENEVKPTAYHYNDSTIYYEVVDCGNENGFDALGGQLFVDIKYHLFDKNFTPFIETTIGGGRKLTGDNFFNSTAAVGIKLYPGNIAFLYDLYYVDKPYHFFGARISATWGKGMFTHR
ncbi:MAG: hypothetical protein IJ911_09970 [Salinivirgaceae bacterium]|nr:hypothetical protein [Salinivirgaceae bacterium]